MVASTPTQTPTDPATPVQAGFASVSRFVPAGQAQKDYALTNCEITVVEGTNITTTVSAFTAATLSFTANGDVSAIFTDSSGESGVRVAPAAIEDSTINSEVPSAAPGTEQHYVSVSFQYGENSAELTVDSRSTRTTFQLSQFGTVSSALRCDMPANALIRQSWPQPTVLGDYLRGVTALDSTRTNTSSLANGVLRWDNLSGTTSPGVAAQGVNRYLQVDLSTGVLSSAASPTAAPSPIAWPAFPNTIAGFDYEVQERTLRSGGRADIQISVTPSAAGPGWILQMFRTNDLIQPVASLAALGS